MAKVRKLVQPDVFTKCAPFPDILDTLSFSTCPWPEETERLLYAQIGLEDKVESREIMRP
jgi:hypothetical protein